MKPNIDTSTDVEDFSSLPPLSFEPIETSRLVPRVSFRAMLVFVSVLAIFFAIMRRADEGAPLAIGVLLAIGFVAVVMVLLCGCFLIANIFAIVWKRTDPDLLEGSPFAEGQLPPQWLPPKEGKP